MRISGCPWGGEHGNGAGWGVQCGIMHMTYGLLDQDTFNGDVSTVANGGLAHFVIGKNDGEWIQLADTESWTGNVGNWDCNHHSVAIEFSGVNENVLTAWQTKAASEVVRQVHDAHGVAIEYDDGSDGANNVAPWHGWNAHRAIAADSGVQHYDFIDRGEWDRIVQAIGGTTTVEVNSMRESDMFIWHNTDAHDPDKNTPGGEWAMRIDKGVISISAGEAYVYVLAGVPWQDHCNTFHVIRGAQQGVLAQRAFEKALVTFK